MTNINGYDADKIADIISNKKIQENLGWQEEFWYKHDKSEILEVVIETLIKAIVFFKGDEYIKYKNSSEYDQFFVELIRYNRHFINVFEPAKL